MKPVRPYMLSSTIALGRALDDQPELLNEQNQISVCGGLSLVDHTHRGVTPTAFKQGKRSVDIAEEDSYSWNLHHFFNVGNTETAVRIQNIVFPSNTSTASGITGISLRPRSPSTSSLPTDVSPFFSRKEFIGIPPPSASPRTTIDVSLTTGDVLLGLDAVDNYENQGIPRSYLEQTQAVANQTKIVIAFRPVERICRTLIEEGVATKGLNIKGKSSNWGPMAGYIPRQQEYSKLAATLDPQRRQLQIREANKANQRVVTLGGVEVTQLILSAKRWEELIDLGHIKNVTNISASAATPQVVSFQSSPKGLSPVNFIGRQQANERWQIYTGSHQPLQIIPKTADFDLFFSFTHFEGSADGETPRSIDPLLGIYSDQDKILITELNKVYNRGDGKEMVHHGSDLSNPNTDLESNLPATVFIPNSMLPMGPYFTSPLLIKSMPDLIKLFHTMRDGGIRIQSNELWPALQAIVKEPFRRTPALSID